MLVFTHTAVNKLLSVAALGTAALIGEPARTGLVRGVVFDLQGNAISLRSAPGDIYRFTFDNRTWIERERERIPGASLHNGELLEVISDRGGLYARMIHVLDRTAPRPPVLEGHLRLFRKKSEAPINGALLEYVGIVTEISENVLKLRTRFDGVKTIYLVPDTRCLNDGVQVMPDVLRPQTHILVKALENRDAETAAVEIVWGRLLTP